MFFSPALAYQGKPSARISWAAILATVEVWPARRAENGFSRLNRIIGTNLSARCDEGQNLEAEVACDVLNKMSALGRPDSIAIPAT